MRILVGQKRLGVASILIMLAIIAILIISGPAQAVPEIKMEITPKKINPESEGVIKVTIYNDTPPGFDVASINISSVEFGTYKAKVFKNKTSADKKLMLFFRTEKTGIRCGDTQVNLTGKTYSGQDIYGNDTIETVCPPPIDTTPPAGVSNLTNLTYAQNYINWTWIDPIDADLAGVHVWVDGSFEDIVSKGLQYYNATGFAPGSEHTIATRTYDTSGNVNQTWVNHTARTAPLDTVPPASVSNLTNITYAQTHINWTWTDPSDTDFSKVMIYLNDSFVTNVSKGVRFYNATGLTSDTSYNISTHTVDTSGNVNQTWVNHTARTAPLLLVVVKMEISPKKINPMSIGVIKVTIYNDTPPGFDVANINISSVEFGPAKAKAFKSKTPAEKLILFFRTEETGIRCGDTQVNLTGKTYSGQDIFGTDTIETVCPPPIDTTPPAGVSNLTNLTYAQNYINWTWIDPTDSDFSHVIVYIDGSFEDIVSKGLQYYNATGFAPGSEHTIATKTFDASGNVNQTWVNHTARTAPLDTIPPASVSNLTNITYAQTHINWTWTDPEDLDFDHVEVYIDNSFKNNVPKGVQFYNASGFGPDTEHTISTRTYDTSGNFNLTWVNHTATTAPSLLLVEAPQAEAPPVSFGGAWAVTGECYENIAKSETRERDIVAGKPVTYIFVSPEIDIYQVVVTGRENEYYVSIKVELLKGPSCLVKAPAPGVIYAYLNVWSGSNRIEDVLIRFRVKNSWIENNNLARTDIRLLKWSKDEWKPLETRETGRDDIYTYFESQTKGFSMFAIAGLAAPTPTPEAAITPVAITPKPAPIAPENEIAAWIMALAAAASIMVITVAASIMVIATIYLLRKGSRETLKRKGWV